jgi:2-hydroxy-3-oxopropionate reductase
MTARPKPAVAFLGIGLMGRPMAERLLEAGYRLAAWNRSPEKAQALAAGGARIAASPADAASGAQVVIVMLSDGAAVEQVLFAGGVANAVAPDATVIDMSSIPPAAARAHAQRLAARGVAHLDAPVSGGVRGASEGSLAIMAGGAPATFRTSEPLLRTLGRATLVGPHGSGQLAKLANQAIVAATIGAVAEALLLARAGGADPAKVREALFGGFADSPVLRQHGERMLERRWGPGGPLRLQVKDMRTVMAEAAALGLDLPVAGRVTQLFEAALSAGLGELDHSALLLELETRNHTAPTASPERGRPE